MTSTCRRTRYRSSPARSHPAEASRCRLASALRALGAVTATLLLAVTPARAQQDAAILTPSLCARIADLDAVALAGPLDELARLGEITGCLVHDDRLVRRGGAAVRHLDSRFALRALPIEWSAVQRGGYADDRNNGALWEGVGLSTSLRAGVQLRAPFITISLQPELLVEQNGEFDTRTVERVGYSEFASPYYTGIDLPQRFGDESRSELVAGDSYARFDLAWFGAGVSAQSLWRGPAVRYPILMSNSAGGFPHIFFGTSRGVDVFVGRLGGEVVWGRLRESEFFDAIADNDETRLVNATVTFEPRWLDGLALGASRSYHYAPGDGDGIAPVLETLGFAATENRDGNELASVFGRWVFPRSGAEIYAEWSRDDVIGRWSEFLQEPDHAQAYMFGFQKVTPVADRVALRVHGELVHLQEKGEARTDSRPIAVFYTNTQVTQGYTHRGQLLGAGVGPGADAQFLAVDALLAAASVGAYYERVRRNDVTLDAFELRRWAPYEHDTELIGGVRGLYFRDAFVFGADLSRRVRLNREFRGNDRTWRLELRAGWQPSLEVSR